MSNTFGVEIFKGQGDLGIDCCGFGLFDSFLGDDFVEEVASFCILHDEVELFGSFDDFVELDNKRVSEFFHDFELAGYPDYIGVLEDQVLFEDLDCYVFLSEFVQSQLDFAEVALAQGSRYRIIFEWLVLLFLHLRLLLLGLILVLNFVLILAFK